MRIHKSYANLRIANELSDTLNISQIFIFENKKTALIAGYLVSFLKELLPFSN